MNDESPKDHKKDKKQSSNNDDIPIDLTCLKGGSVNESEKEINLVIHCPVCDKYFYSDSGFKTHSCRSDNLYSVK
jgi:hypothetical protein